MNALHLWRTSWSAHPSQGRNHRDGVAEHEVLLVVWLAFFGLLVFASWLLWQLGVWQMLVAADPTLLTVVILVIFTAATLWVGRRSHLLSRQHAWLAEARGLLAGPPPNAAALLATLRTQPQSWVHGYLADLIAKGPAHWRGNGQLTDLLAEKAHGAHETAWWFNAALLKLGLLGKVIGFSIMALSLGSLDSIEATQTATLLKTLTAGLGTALLTTMTGLVGNILLGLQLSRLDRMADGLVADALELAENGLARVFPAE